MYLYDKLLNNKVFLETVEKIENIKFITDANFDVSILKAWPKAITVPYKVAQYLKRNYKFIVNDVQIDISDFLN